MEPIASALAAQSGPKAAKDTDQDELEPKVLGESKFDRVSSFLMAVVLSAILVVGWLGLIYITNQAYASRVTAPLQIIDVYGGGGGTPEGTPGSTEKIDIAGADAAAMASNNEVPAGEFEQPSVQQLPGAMLETVVESGQNLAEVDIGPVMPSGGAVASGKRASKLGTGGPGFGFGPGDGGVAREQRWSIIYDPGQTAEEYARQLDALRVQLAVVVDQNQLHYAWNFSSAKPDTRFGVGRSDHRLYFLWQGRGRKSSDIALLQKAGIEVGEGVVLQFYPPEAETRLAELEVRFKGRSPAEIRVTRFRVVPKAGSYDFEVVAQETLR
ncbi:MAG: hypothetical protein ACLQIB_18935 [Isosphaeraceae bacterium]